MQLQPGERSILAYFSNPEAAAAAVAQLEALGFQDTQLSRINNYTRLNNRAVSNSISALTAAGDNPEHYRSYGPLLASSPIVSGLAANEAAYYTHMVTVVSGEPQIQQALNILREYGGKA